MKRDKERERAREKERERLPSKSKKKRGRVGGRENRAHSERQRCLIPLLGFKGAVCVCICVYGKWDL